MASTFRVSTPTPNPGFYSDPKFADGRKLDEVARKPERGESSFGQWQRKVSREDSGWEIRFDFVASEERFSPEDYREFSEFQRKAIDAVEKPLLLQE